MNSLHQFLTAVDVPLAQIYLDPNNPRFTEANWNYVAEQDWDNAEVQDAAQRRLISDFGIEKLRMNIEVNGFLAIDRVVIQKFSEDKYVVLEGNRRICAAKLIGAIAMDGSAVSASVLESLEVIPCLLYTGTDNDAAWIFQGLRHISGIVEWSAFNKAKLLVEQMEKEQLSLTDVGKRFGLSAHGAGQWVRGYSAFIQGKEGSDYINEIDERSYPYFQELFGRSSAPIRDWLEWDESEYRFNNALNFDEFISWLYPRGNAEIESAVFKKGDFEKRRVARRDDLRQISDLMVKDPEFFENFRGGMALEACYAQALAKRHEASMKRDPLRDLFTAVQTCVDAIGNIPFKTMKNKDTRAEVAAELQRLKEALSEFEAE